MFKFIKRVVLTLLIVAFLIICIVVGMGYAGYKDVSDNMSIEAHVEAIRAQQNYTDIEDISKDMKDAVVAIEDRRFYDHNGVDYYALVRSLVVNLSNQGRQGGSTITQQLAKHMYFMENNDGIHKVSEAFVAREIEKEYSKDEILEMYLNVVYYGDGHTGIYEASMGYYHVLPKDLNLEQASVLAGMPQAPSVYMLSNKDSITKDRQLQVLKSMLDLHMISTKEYEAVKEVDIFK